MLAPPDPSINVLRAASASTLVEAARLYLAAGYSVIPLKGKRPATRWWSYMKQPATPSEVRHWLRSGRLHNLGLVCGRVSHNLVVLDLDGLAACAAFQSTFPELSQTFTILTGSGCGKHFYFHVGTLPQNAAALHCSLGNLELRAEGQQVVCPPSRHPDTGKSYEIVAPHSIRRLDDLEPVVGWIESHKLKSEATHQQPYHGSNFQGKPLHPDYIAPVADYFSQRGYVPRGNWLNGPCIYPQRHTNLDRNISFGYNTATGYAWCWRCGSMTTREVAAQLNIPVFTQL